jgi:hypothetical protein
LNKRSWNSCFAHSSKRNAYITREWQMHTRISPEKSVPLSFVWNTSQIRPAQYFGLAIPSQIGVWRTTLHFESMVQYYHPTMTTIVQFFLHAK